MSNSVLDSFVNVCDSMTQTDQNKNLEEQKNEQDNEQDVKKQDNEQNNEQNSGQNNGQNNECVCNSQCDCRMLRKCPLGAFKWLPIGLSVFILVSYVVAPRRFFGL